MCYIKKLFLKILQYLQETPMSESVFNKVSGLQACNCIKKRLQQMFFVNIVKFLRTSILKKICERLLLKYISNSYRLYYEFIHMKEFNVNTTEILIYHHLKIMLFILLKINSISDSRKIFLFLLARQLLILYSVWILL